MAENNPSSEDRKNEGTYQMLWDCKFCGTEKLLGVTHRHCPNCGAAQDTEHRYFPAEADMVALEDHKYVGADKKCPACGQPNSAASTYCSECGADLATGEVVATFGARELGTGIAETDTRRDVTKEKFEAEMVRVGVIEADQPVFLGLRKKHLITGAIIAAVLVVIAGIIYALTYRSDETGTVSAVTWQRTIEIEEFQQLSNQSWDDGVPEDAYNVRCKEEQRGTEQVQVGSHRECQDVDQGDGSFRRECWDVPDYESRPVYDERCTYTVDRWVVARQVQADNAQSRMLLPAWPQYTLAAGIGAKNYGRERTGQRYETYDVVFTLNGKTERCSVDQATWKNFTSGTSITVEVGLAGNPDCDTLKIAE